MAGLTLSSSAATIAATPEAETEIGRLVKALPSSDWSPGIVEEILAIDAQRGRQALVDATRSDDPELRTAARLAVTTLDGDDVVPVLLESLDDADVAVRVEALGALACPRPRGVGGLSPRPRALHGPLAAVVLAALRSALDDPSPFVREQAICSTGVLGPRAVPALAALLAHFGHASGKERSFTLGALASIAADDPRVTSHLCEALSDPDDGVRGRAATLLTLRSDAAALELLRHDDARVRAAAADAVGTPFWMPLHPRPSRVDPAVVAALISTLRDREANVRRGAAHALGAMERLADAARPELTRALHDPDEWARHAARAALRRLSPPDEEPDLVDLPFAELEIVSRVPPAYPLWALAEGLRGTVVLEVIVASDGSVESVHVLSGEPRLAAMAAEAVARWELAPVLSVGRPARVRTTLAIDPASR